MWKTGMWRIRCQLTHTIETHVQPTDNPARPHELHINNPAARAGQVADHLNNHIEEVFFLVVIKPSAKPLRTIIATR